MTAMYVSLVASLPRIAGFAVETAAKAALLCLVVWALHLLVGRKRLLLRSVLWNVCLVGLLLLPITVAVLPRLNVATSLTAIENQPFQHELNEPDTQIVAAELNQVAANDVDNSSPGIATVELASSETPTFAAGDSAAPAQPGYRRLGQFALIALLAIYGLTLAVLVIRLCASLLAVAALRRRGVPVVNVAWSQSLERWRSQLALRSNVELRQAASVSVPVVVGWRRPTILLPESLAEKTDPQVIDAVLLHELTHVERGDYAWNLLLRIVRAVYWPHPCVWLVDHFVALGREAVCDAVCVHWMGDVHAYRSVLVDVAAALMPRSRVAIGMAMASSSKLGRRLARVEQSPDIKRGLLASPLRIGIAGAAILCAGLLGSTQLAARAAVKANADGQAEFTPAGADLAVNDQKQQSQEQSPQTQPSQESANDAPESAGSQKPTAIDPKSEEQSKPEEKSSSEPLRVETVKVKRGKLEKTLNFLTLLTSSGQMSIPARTPGVIAKTFVEAGDRVKSGQVLAELDIPDIRAEVAAKKALLDQAQTDQQHSMVAVIAAEATVMSKLAAMAEADAELQRATAAEAFEKRQYQRSKDLFDKKVIGEGGLDEQNEKLETAVGNKVTTSAKLDSAKAAVSRSKVEVQLAKTLVESAAARVAAAQGELKRITAMTEESARLIRSPIDGVVLERNVEPGSFVKPGDEKPLFRLTSTSHLTAVVQIPEQDALAVKVGESATVLLDALRVQPAIEAKIIRVSSSVNIQTGTLTAEMLLPNPEGLLKPGMRGTARIAVEPVADALSIPASALYQVNQATAGATTPRFTCFRVVEGRTVRTPVKVGLFAGVDVQILEGLSEGDVVALGLKNSTPDGQLVEPVPAP